MHTPFTNSSKLTVERGMWCEGASECVCVRAMQIHPARLTDSLLPSMCVCVCVCVCDFECESSWTNLRRARTREQTFTHTETKQRQHAHTHSCGLHLQPVYMTNKEIDHTATGVPIKQRRQHERAGRMQRLSPRTPSL